VAVGHGRMMCVSAWELDCLWPCAVKNLLYR
jgi:hypothetical protein